jgi:hypothetical protein
MENEIYNRVMILPRLTKNPFRFSKQKFGRRNNQKKAWSYAIFSSSLWAIQGGHLSHVTISSLLSNEKLQLSTCLSVSPLGEKNTV